MFNDVKLLDIKNKLLFGMDEDELLKSCVIVFCMIV